MPNHLETNTEINDSKWIITSVGYLIIMTVNLYRETMNLASHTREEKAGEYH